MHGDYRKMFSRAEELEVHTCRFKSKEDDLLEAFEDLKVLAERQKEGPHFAILLKFNLQKSNYATMLIREFCHISSSFENQELINKSGEDAENFAAEGGNPEETKEPDDMAEEVLDN